MTPPELAPTLRISTNDAGARPARLGRVGGFTVSNERTKAVRVAAAISTWLTFAKGHRLHPMEAKMHTLLSVLAVGLFVLVAAPQNALACHKGDPGIPHGAQTSCDGLPPPSGGIGTLLDENGVTIGQVVGIGAQGAPAKPIVNILFEVDGQTFSAAVVSAFPGGSSMGEGFQLNAKVWFSQSNCMGDAWVTPGVGSAFFEEFRIAIIATDAPDERRMFHVVPGTAITLDVPLQSSMETECIEGGPNLGVFSAMELDPDLHSTFPKPYSLDLN